MSRSDVIAKNNKWVPVKREKTSIYLSKYKSTSSAIKRTQFPLVFPLQFTRCRVVSLISVVLSFDLEKQKSFNEVQMHVVVSRVTSIDIFLIGKYHRNGFKVNKSAVAEYNRLQENRFDTINKDYVDCNSLTVPLLNTHQQSQAAYKKRYSLLDWKSNYKLYWWDRNQRVVKYFWDLLQFR